MAQTYGIEASHTSPSAQGQGQGQAAQPAAKYLVLIDSAGSGGRLARMFLPTLQQVAEFDAAAPEVLSMIDGLHSAHDALQPRWDAALMGHSPGERERAEIYTFDT